MRAVIQRVGSAQLSVDGEVKAEIGRGLVVYVGVEHADDSSAVDAFAKKITAMRIFQDDADKMNLSVATIRGDILLVPNFTLCADISHGNRPSFTGAKRPPSEASVVFDALVRAVQSAMLGVDGAKVERGIFGADMQIMQVNEGPVTIIY